MIEHTGRTNIGSVVFFDIVGYSKATDANQIAMKQLLNTLIAEGVRGIAAEERVILDTGDGAAICFLGDPEDALYVATAVLHGVREETGAARQQLRTGINLGAIKAITDLNGRPNVVGDGINVAQRIMDFADPNEILVSRSYFEVVSRLQEGNEHLFIPMGSKKDKHVREHQLYAISPSAISAIGHRMRTREIEDAPEDAPVGATAPLPAAALAEVEHRLAERIGPLARVLVHKAAAEATSLGGLYDTVALSIQDAADRAAFLSEKPAEEPADAAPGPAEAPAPPSTPLSPQDLADAERLLTEIMGPVAGVLVRQAAGDSTSRQELFEHLAQRITSESARARFLRAVEG